MVRILRRCFCAIPENQFPNRMFTVATDGTFIFRRLRTEKRWAQATARLTVEERDDLQEALDLLEDEPLSPATPATPLSKHSPSTNNKQEEKGGSHKLISSSSEDEWAWGTGLARKDYESLVKKAKARVIF